MSPPRNAPLAARSVLASVLLGTEPPWLPTTMLVRTGELFGIAEGTVRTALSRMAASDELVADGGGYRLTGHLVDRQRRQDASRQAKVRTWDGTWEVVTIDGTSARAASDRAGLRKALSTLRLAELREGVWGRPDNLDADRSNEARQVVEGWCTTWRGGRPTPEPAVSRLWPLAAWAGEASERERELTSLEGPLRDDDLDALAAGFVASAAVLRLFQRDPLLPPGLLPEGWPGRALRSAYESFDHTYRGALQRWFRRST